MEGSDNSNRITLVQKLFNYDQSYFQYISKRNDKTCIYCFIHLPNWKFSAKSDRCFKDCIMYKNSLVDFTAVINVYKKNWDTHAHTFLQKVINDGKS